MGEEVVFEEIRIPEQKWRAEVAFPAVLAPAGVPDGSSDNAGLVGTVQIGMAAVETALRKSGAVLFRGFPVRTAEEFNEVVEAFGWEEFPYIGGSGMRKNVVGRVFTANESPPDRKIPFHHEMAHVPEFPSKLFFFCEVKPTEGGETPIVLSHLIYERMKEKYPEFVSRLEEHGLIYARVLGQGDDPSCPLGRGWQSTFLTTDRKVAEERAAKLGMKLEWIDDGVKVVMGPNPAIKIDSTSGRKVWFNSLVAAYTGFEDARNDPVKAVTFGDGTPLPADIVYDCVKILEEESVAIPWQQGDVLLIDNTTVLHSRRSFQPPRRILASLCK